MSDQNTCQICGRTKEQHNSSVVHQYSPREAHVDVSQFGPKRSKTREGRHHTNDDTETSWGYTQAPFDPVLRQALIDKGIISAADLIEAENKIAVLTQQVTTRK